MVFHKHIDTEHLEDSCQTLVDSMDLLETSNHEVSADGDPYLGLHSVLGAAIEGLDAQVLFDPLEEELDTPPRLVDGGHRFGGKCKVVGEEDQIHLGLRVNVVDSSQQDRVQVPGLDSGQTDALIASESGLGVNGTGLPDPKVKIALGPDDEERAGLCNGIKAFIIDESPVHDINASRLKWNAVKKVHVIDRSFCDIDKNWDRALQGHLGVDFDRGLGRPECCPRKHRKTQIDGRGVDGVNHLLDIDSVRIITIESLSLPYQNFGYLCIHSPISVLVGVGEIGTCHPSPYPHCIQEGVVSQAGFNVAQSFAEGQLGEDHGQELVAGAESLTGSGHRIKLQTTRQLLGIEHVRYLRENKAAAVHPLLRLPASSSGEPFQIEDTLFALLTSDNKQHAKN